MREKPLQQLSGANSNKNKIPDIAGLFVWDTIPSTHAHAKYNLESR